MKRALEWRAVPFDQFDAIIDRRIEKTARR